MAAPFTVETPRSDFIWEKHVEEGILFRGVGEMASYTKAETCFVATEVVYGDYEVPIRGWERGELVEFVLHIPVSVDLGV